MNGKIVLAFVAGMALVLLIGAGGKMKSPTGIVEDRYAYYPGTEELKPDEIRLIACGTGMPTAVPGHSGTHFPGPVTFSGTTSPTTT